MSTFPGSCRLQTFVYVPFDISMVKVRVGIMSPGLKGDVDDFEHRLPAGVRRNGNRQAVVPGPENEVPRCGAFPQGNESELGVGNGVGGRFHVGKVMQM